MNNIVEERAAGITVGIDASRNRSGGGIVHLVGLLTAGDPRKHGVRSVHVWAYASLLSELPDADWLVKHSPPQLNRSLASQMWWQYRHLPDEARAAGVDILLNTDAGTVCPFRPAVVMSRDMLSYEPGEMRRFGLSRDWLRLLALRYVQAASMRRADGVIFLTRYAARVIQRFTGALIRTAIIPHGVADAFRNAPSDSLEQNGKALRCVYVSPLYLYKHQWHVVRAVGDVRRRGYDITLELVGGGSGRARRLLEEELELTDPRREFVKDSGFVPVNDLPAVLKAADLFVFASSCENMPNTLTEAMASGLPIACAQRGPMPEVLQDGGLYFDPEDPESISAAIEKLIDDPAQRLAKARRAFELAEQYSWERCARETWAFLRQTLAQVRQCDARLPELAHNEGKR